jgi:hypothetical protein
MTNILDTVEPDAYRYNKVRGLNKEPFGTEYSEAPPRQNPGLEEQCSSVDPLYSRETVERMLAEHRKQVLLEAAKHFESLSFVDMDETGRVVVAYAEDELRSMAEGEK